ncbi:DNA topoisomerase-3 [Mobilisporobacter senegalensis]|uniref:DNA topoisomerase 3 n=1 Tax=Mobilisporobacter senegalensis TaxID=1329262 RepID=A0A3N1XYA7_9FIRM|nr:DNA topoisomerase III [Mobilisporobacter senegalensis]ROR31584.1 DNA topoisomerase-3 [Mobilisporobacter senegalensis]
MKSLILAEKPSVARDIARVLKCQKKIPGALEGNQYIVTWALGHLVTLADPEEYDKKYKEWKIEDLPMIPKKWELVVIKQTSKQYSSVKTQLFRKDVSEIIIATDAGREGELVARWILEKSGCHKPIKRLWISSVTDKAIKEGFARLKDGRDYNSLYHAAQSRAEADWLVGINGTRALTCKYNASLSCGRVQTPTLAMIARREEEIKNFRPEEYYGIECMAGSIKWTWQNLKNGSFRCFQKEFMETLSKELEQEKLTINEINKSAKKTYSPGLYDLTELQRDANRRFGFSAKETLNIMQRLYENHKVLTYPRTDSRYIGSDIVPTLKERLQACSTGPYRKLAGQLITKPLQTNKSFVDDKKVSDHHAIIPTEQFVQLDHMTNEERKIYDLVVRRFFSVLYPPFEYEQTTLKASAKNQTFVAKGKVIHSPGWKAVYETEILEDEEESALSSGLSDQALPELAKGGQLLISNVMGTTGKTKPPARFTEATLLSAMENPSKYMDSDDARAKKTLGETGGLGTVATRADIIEKLFHSFLMEKRGNEILITSKGKQLLELIPEDLKKPELTAKWEMELSSIALGKRKSSIFIDDIQKYTEELILEIRQSDGSFRHDNLTNNKCPHCGKRMLSVNGKNARLLVCQDRECGYRETVAKLTNARCPNCHKKMELIKKGEDETFICSCGYKEKLSSFKNRREKEGAGVNKKDVQKYLKTQKEESVNTAFADAFSKLKL